MDLRLDISTTELLPDDVVCAKETRDLVIECCVGEEPIPASSTFLPPSLTGRIPCFVPRSEFIHLISSEANEICEQESKKTIAPEHIIGALNVRPLSTSAISLKNGANAECYCTAARV